MISPGDVYPNRKVKLEDADITEETREKFEELCDRHPNAFSKNNKDIGRTTLIEMEIDTGDSLPKAQNPYTLPLKHHEWVRKEIETLEKAGVIERSLSPWASPVIVVPKKSAPDEPPRRCLCVDYRKVNSLQQEVKWTDRGTGCLSLYPLPKIDEMFAKLNGAKCFSTIDLRSGYYQSRKELASTVCDAYRAHVYCIFGSSVRILTDNRTEFRNEQMDELCRQLNVKRVYSPVYTPEANQRLEAWHRFFKTCVAKHIRGNAAEWDEVVPLAGAAYNFFPCQASGESPFVLMFGRDPITPFAKLLEPAPRYWGDRGGHLKMDLLRKLYLLTAENVKRAREGRDPVEMTRQRNDLKVNDLVLLRDQTSGAFAPRYMPNYRIVAVHCPNRITVRDEKGNETVRRASHLKACDWKQKVTSMVPDQGEYDKFGRNTKLLLHPKDIPNVQFDRKARNKGEISPDAEISMIKVNITSGRDEYSEIPPKQLPIKVSSDTFADKEKSVDILDLCEESGEFPPKVQNQVQNQMLNLSKQYIEGSVEKRVNQSNSSRSRYDDKGNRNT